VYVVPEDDSEHASSADLPRFSTSPVCQTDISSSRQPELDGRIHHEQPELGPYFSRADGAVRTLGRKQVVAERRCVASFSARPNAIRGAENA